MNLCIDVGNTCIKLGWFRGKTLVSKATVPLKDRDALRVALQKNKHRAVNHAIVCSVVPAENKRICALVKKQYAVIPYVVNENCRVAIDSEYAKKTPLGNDRLVNIVGALYTYPLPCIIISFGTAITLDYVSLEGVHKGGFILPGLRLSREALADHTAVLPKVPLSAINCVYGTDTVSCIKAGVVYGVAAAVDGLVSRIKKQCARKPVIVAVGNDAPFMQQYCSSIDCTTKNHTLSSLNWIVDSLQ